MGIMVYSLSWVLQDFFINRSVLLKAPFLGP